MRGEKVGLGIMKRRYGEEKVGRGRQRKKGKGREKVEKMRGGRRERRVEIDMMRHKVITKMRVEEMLKM